MVVDRHVDSVTGKTFTTSAAFGYSNSQIMPYSHAYTDPPQITAKQVKARSFRGWNINDAEVKRKRRVASYKVYTVEGKVKMSIRKSIRWVKTKYIEMRYGWW
eukprot:c24276_g1_i2 orf=473-781(-)